jgi:hypothetical protein
MNRVLLALLLVALLAAPSFARQFTPYQGSYPSTTPSRTPIELEYDGGVFYGYGMSPNWTDETAVIFMAPAGGPFAVTDVRYYATGTTVHQVHFYASPDIWGPPTGSPTVGPNFTPVSAPPWPPADWTTVDVTGMGMTVDTGDIVAPAWSLLGTDAGIGLAYAYNDGNPGHSWAMYGGMWTDDTYGYGTDDGIRLGLDTAGPTPTEETTWGAVKGMFR